MGTPSWGGGTKQDARHAARMGGTRWAVPDGRTEAPVATRALRRTLLPGVAAGWGAGLMGAPAATAKAPTFAGPFEQQLTHDDRYANGEPSIAVNPRNPRNIIITF